MQKTFISYSRENKPDIDQLVEHLNGLGCRPWVDSSGLHGSQDWWQEILRQIQDCDVFIPIISEEALKSVACEREFDWAEVLGKPVLPVATEPLPAGLHRRYSSRQIVDYSEPADRDRAALRLAAALLALPPAPPPPNPLPTPPAAPLSYLTDLDELVSARTALNQAQQREVLVSLEPALRSVDSDERRGGRRILERFGSRGDLYADVDRKIQELKRLNDEASRTDPAESGQKPSFLVGGPTESRSPDRADDDRCRLEPNQAERTERDPESTDHPGFRQSNLGIPALVIAIAGITGAIPPIATLSTNYNNPPEIWFVQDISRILVGIAFCSLALKAESFSAKFLMTTGYLMLPITILQLIDHAVAYARRFSPEDQVFELATVFAYPALLALASLVAIVFGWAVFRAERLAWASIMTSWGVCGLLMTFLSYLARVHPETAPVADSVLIMQNFVLFAVAILMYRESRATIRLAWDRPDRADSRELDS